MIYKNWRGSIYSVKEIIWKLEERSDCSVE